MDKKLKLHLEAKGVENKDLVEALSEGLRLLKEDFTSGKNSNETGEFWFTVVPTDPPANAYKVEPQLPPVDISTLPIGCQLTRAGDNEGVVPYSLKSVAYHVGREGYGFNATLWHFGKKIGVVQDEGSGGCLNWYTDTREEREALCDYVVTLPFYNMYHGDMAKYMPEGYRGTMPSVDSFLEALLAEHERNKQRKKLKTKTIFTLHSKPGYEMTVNQPFTNALGERLRKQHGADLKEILNETLGVCGA
jgi:hypothetical protein